MLFTHVGNFVHKSPKITKLFRRFREEIAPVWVKIVVVFGQSIFIKSLIYQLSSLVLEIFFEWVVILKFLILFCVWSIYVFSAPFLKKVCLNFELKTWKNKRGKKSKTARLNLKSHFLLFFKKLLQNLHIYNILLNNNPRLNNNPPLFKHIF